MSYEQSLRAVADRMKSARRAAIFTHQRPDADAIGSQVALALMLRAIGANVTIMHQSEPPPACRFLLDLTDARQEMVAETWRPASLDGFDTVCVVDTCAWQQLEPARASLENARPRVLVLDHHQSRDPVGDLTVFDTGAAACVEIVADLGKTLRIGLDRPTATALLTGLVADTGWFRFDSVTPRTLNLAASCMETGVSNAAIYEQLMQREKPSRLALMASALAGLRYDGDAEIATMVLTQADIANAGAGPTETEGLVDLPMQIASVEVAVMLTEMPDGRMRGSMRSKHDIDVNAICGRFGGGGHVRAAGCRLDGPPERARERIIAAIGEALPKSPHAA